MRNIYTGIDLGSDNIKIVVSEFINGKFYVLASTSVKSVGIRRGVLVDHNMVMDFLTNSDHSSEEEDNGFLDRETIYKLKERNK